MPFLPPMTGNGDDWGMISPKCGTSPQPVVIGWAGFCVGGRWHIRAWYDMRLRKDLIGNRTPQNPWYSMNESLLYQEMHAKCHKTQLKIVWVFQWYSIGIPMVSKPYATHWCLGFQSKAMVKSPSLALTRPWNALVHSPMLVPTIFMLHAPWESTDLGFEKTCLRDSSF